MEDKKITLWFSNNDFKYETEATVKLFIKSKRFEFCFDEKPKTDDFILIRFKEGRKNNYFTVVVSVDDIKKRRMSAVSKEKSSDKSTKESILCHLLYDLLKEITGKTPAWGLITGIRPVKKVNDLIAKNYSKTEIFDYLKKQYDVSDSKLNLAYNTAITQKELLNLKDSRYIALYISIPFCPSRCSYCSFVSQSVEKSGNLIPLYLEKLCDELKIIAEIVRQKNLIIDSIYIGGGTPTTLSAEQIDILMSAVYDNFDLSNIREYCVEAGRPDTITAEKIFAIKSGGATRVSVNPQTMNDEVLKNIGRKHTVADTLKAYDIVKSAGFDSVNMDIIAGLPSDTEDSFFKTIDECIRLNPENITVHTLTLKRCADLFSQWQNSIETPVEKMVNYSQKTLTENGYMPYYLYRQKNTLENLENVGYTKQGFASLYNILIMEETQTILGAGCGASTKLVFPDGKIKRIHNYKFPYEYIKDFDKLMTKKQDIDLLYQI